MADTVLEEFRAQLYAVRAQVDAMILRVEGVLGEAAITCPHPEDEWLPTNFGQVPVCGRCRQPVRQGS
jgi:hypothetical protein